MRDMKIKNLFLDRDGTIIVEKHYLKDPDEVELLPNAVDGLKKFVEKGVNLFIVTNQSGIGRGYFSVQDLYKVNKRLCDILSLYHVQIKDIEFCPHSPDDNCRCRKPKTYMWEKLQKKYNLISHETVVIGDKLSDVLMGRNAGFILNALVLTGYGEYSLKKGPIDCFDLIAKDLLDFYYLLENRGCL